MLPARDVSILFTQLPEIKLVAGEYCLYRVYIQQILSVMLQQIGLVQLSPL